MGAGGSVSVMVVSGNTRGHPCKPLRRRTQSSARGSVRRVHRVISLFYGLGAADMMAFVLTTLSVVVLVKNPVHNTGS